MSNKDDKEVSERTRVTVTLLVGGENLDYLAFGIMGLSGYEELRAFKVKEFINIASAKLKFFNNGQATNVALLDALLTKMAFNTAFSSYIANSIQNGSKKNKLDVDEMRKALHMTQQEREEAKHEKENEEDIAKMKKERITKMAKRMEKNIEKNNQPTEKQ